MISYLDADARGHTGTDWLDSWHSFSFGAYFDPARVGFRSLRVINEDRIAPGGGFPTHGHADMEIVTYVLEGALAHRDSLGNGSVIRPGDVQRMSAGTGIAHSEFNASRSEGVHLLQIWLFPDRQGLTPGYEQKHFDKSALQGRLALVADPAGANGAVTIHQDARIYAGMLAAGERASHSLAPGRGGYLHVARGKVALNGKALAAGDEAFFEDEPSVALAAETEAEILLFDLA
jgi:redox-sensitive bicupin YhaK (pirin superfamily)